MVVAAYLSNRILPVGWKDLIISVVLVMIPVLLIAKQPDLGTAILVGSAGFFVLFLAGVRWRIMLVLGVLLSSVIETVRRSVLSLNTVKRLSPNLST